MISESLIKELRAKWQTTELNVVREYVQHVILSSLFGGLSQDVKLAFKGGTAFRLLYRSPRFSEDLDFTGWAKGFHVKQWIGQTLGEASKAGLEFSVLESRATSGGWFALAQTRVHTWPIRVEWNISLRQQRSVETETLLVASPLWPPYSVKALPAGRMVEEKIEALRRRRQPRDFFDLYYCLRERLGVKNIVDSKAPLIKLVKELNRTMVEKELKQLLPRSQWNLARQLDRILRQELERL